MSVPVLPEKIRVLFERHCPCGVAGCLNDSSEHLAAGPVYPNLGRYSRLIERERKASVPLTLTHQRTEVLGGWAGASSGGSYLIITQGAPPEATCPRTTGCGKTARLTYTCGCCEL